MIIKSLWAARDSWGDIYLYKEKPFAIINSDSKVTSHSHNLCWLLPEDWIPELTVEKSPVEVELKIKENGD